MTATEMKPRRASAAFSFVVLLTLVLFGFIGVVLFHPRLIGHALGHDTAGHISQHFREHQHRMHDLTFSFILGTAVVGTLVQVRRPSENFAGQLMALIAWLALGLAFVVATSWLPFAPAPILATLTLLATLLHPARREFFRSFSISRVNRTMLVLVVIAAVPLSAFASGNIGLQRTVTNDHAALGHYGFMAAFSFTVIGVGLLASMRLDGWRLTAWVVGCLAVLLGLASLVFPDVDSSVSLVWTIAAIVWGVAFVLAAQSSPDEPHRNGRRSVVPDAPNVSLSASSLDSSTISHPARRGVWALGWASRRSRRANAQGSCAPRGSGGEGFFYF
jgi:hypothetical protein